MKVKDVMTPDAKAIWLTESLAASGTNRSNFNCFGVSQVRDHLRIDPYF